MFLRSFVALIAAALLSTVGVASQPVAAADYPSRPVTIVVPYGPGGGVGINTRALAPHLEKALGQKVLVVHRTGAGGVTGHTIGAFAKPDGYTLTMVSTGIAAAPWLVPGVKFTPEDYAYIGQVSFVPNFLIVAKDSPYKTVSDLVAAMKKAPGEFPAGMTNGWPSSTIAQVMFLDQAGVEAKVVPGFKGGASKMAALLGHHISFSFNNVNEVLPQVGEGGKIRVLAACALERSPFLPDVPTFKELGMNVTLGVWRTLAAPKDTPQEILDTLNAALVKALNTPELKADFKKVGLTVDYLNPQDTRELVMQQYQDLGRLFTKLGINVKTKKM